MYQSDLILQEADKDKMTRREDQGRENERREDDKERGSEERG